VRDRRTGDQRETTCEPVTLRYHFLSPTSVLDSVQKLESLTSDLRLSLGCLHFILLSKMEKNNHVVSTGTDERKKENHNEASWK
jgi:hypothetical protein